MPVEDELVLLVEAEPETREAATRCLREMALECVTAAGAEEALKAASGKRISLVVAAIGASGEKEWAMVEELRKSSPDLAAIFIATPEGAEAAIDYLDKGVDCCLRKPLNPREFRAFARRALEHREAAISRREHRKVLRDKLYDQTLKMRRTFLSAVESLAYCLEAKDPYTKGHSDRVARLSTALMRQLKAETPTEGQVHLAGRLHDIGKIGVKESVLQKAGPLSEDEFDHIRAHPRIAATILRPVIRDTVVTDIILHHHERFDGRGYPVGLQGEDIPLGARVLAVADSFDAMTSPRPYRPPESVGSALKEIRECAGSRYDPAVVKALGELVTVGDWLGQLKEAKTRTR